jgi:hypothetical protein
MVDNGEHLFAGCYDALLEYVGTIGTGDLLRWDATPFAIRRRRPRLSGCLSGCPEVTAP